ncbi:MAG: hypothetical protein GY699_07500 [Desulfobacteraceae bacterium]|nr:hypothetical protein [Desulfobacteraceae bacterium]
MDKKNFRFYYGIILIAVGFGVFYRIPQVMPKIETIEFFRQKLIVVKTCLYFLGTFLIIAGGIRIYKNYK